MADWKPPPFGTPVWLGIPAQDVKRASAFYGTVFNLPFKDHKESVPKDEIQLFDFQSNGLSIGGGILKAPDETGVVSTSKGGVCIHWFVEDVDAIAKVIENAGGKMLTERVKEGGSGIYRYFEDTEGNTGSVYMMV